MALAARILTFCSILLFLPLSPQAGAAQSKQKEPAPKGTPVLWQVPRDIASRNLYYGPGGRSMTPDIRKVTFVEEVEGGYSTKYRVRDAAGREWVAKLGKEAQSETAATRLLWAIGYHTEITYLVPRVRIDGKGTFQDVRFEARPKSIERLDEWKWEDNPFVGRTEFQGLKAMMALLNNWDIKDENNKVLLVRDGRTRRNQLRYIISDLGATFGKTGSLPVIWRITRSRSNPEDYEESKFLDGVKGKFVDFDYSGKNEHLFDDITTAQARWLGGWLARLSTQQIRDAFRAANYDRDEVQMLTEAVRRRIRQLNRL